MNIGRKRSLLRLFAAGVAPATAVAGLWGVPGGLVEGFFPGPGYLC